MPQTARWKKYHEAQASKATPTYSEPKFNRGHPV
ncbi:Uncharacterised protein [Vibrio cholerae]|nr:Uncharacterised protein [Vibrio cholerae]